MEDTTVPTLDELIEQAPKRYSVVRMSYVWAKDLVEAEQIAQAMAEEENRQEDSSCIIKSVVPAEFGKI